ncbi:MAG: hypothetical protein ACI4UE_01675 [Candidatus Scatovivens sp.]
MKKYRIFIICSLIIGIVCFIGLNYSSNADMGIKPSITINLKNMKTQNYLIDILVFDETGKYYSKPLNYNGNEGEQYSEDYNSLRTITVEQLKILHDINFDGWISEGTRWNPYLLFADCSGNSKHEHYFSYYGTPETYKVVIVLDNGEIRVTDVIHRTDFQSEITIDVNNMKISERGNILTSLKAILIPLILTIIIEIIIALLMKFKNIKVIFIANVITNILLQILLINIPLTYISNFVILEILVFIAEYLIYTKFLKDIDKSKILSYTLLANLITAILTFVIY